MNFLGEWFGALGWLGSCLRRNDEEGAQEGWRGLGGVGDRGVARAVVVVRGVPPPT